MAHPARKTSQHAPTGRRKRATQSRRRIVGAGPSEASGEAGSYPGEQPTIDEGLPQNARPHSLEDPTEVSPRERPFIGGVRRRVAKENG